MTALSLTLAMACARERDESENLRPVETSSAPAAIASITVDEARSIEQSCIGICAHSRTLQCSNAAECMKSCVSMAAATPCSDAIEALYKCLTGEPAAHWECADDGIAAIREGYCENEQARAVACMEAKAQR
jgi:hypothetical protein